MWVVIPRNAISLLDRTQFRDDFVEYLIEVQRLALLNKNDQFDTKHIYPSIKHIGSHGVSFFPISNSAYLVMVYNADDINELSLTGEPIISIWAGTGKTIWSHGTSAACAMLQRAIELTTRLWDRQALPHQYEIKKINNINTIYAASRDSTSLRLCYQKRVIDDRIVVDIGTTFVPWRDPSSIKPLQEAVIRLIPNRLDIPAGYIFQADSYEEEVQDESDLIMNAPTGESLHLFSLSYSAWVGPEGLLTKQQRRVIEHTLTRPLRIHGKAGSGKTLVLILKALKILRDSQTDSKPCRLLFVAHSTAMRNTILRACEAIDDHGFLASQRVDPQFFDVETLHGWSIRELGQEIGLRYVVDADPTVSREHQIQVLQSVINDILPGKISSVGDLCSKDFIGLFENKPDEFVKKMAWEIGIRIKGCGLKSTNKDLELYVKNSTPPFIGRNATPIDKRIIFRIYQAYEDYFQRRGLIDTDDIILSMAARLKTNLWDRQRRSLGYDYVFVDEAHLFNENERRVLPYLTTGTSEFLPLVLTFDEAQSIGGTRSLGLAELGIESSDRKVLNVVHRSSEDIVALSQYLLDKGPLLFSEFNTPNTKTRMAEKERRKCERPSLVLVNQRAINHTIATICEKLRNANMPKIGIIVFNDGSLNQIYDELVRMGRPVHIVKERGDIVAAIPTPGYYLMYPESCGGLEFDAVVLTGVDSGNIPPDDFEMSPEGHMAAEEDCYRQLYTAITRARYRLVFICDVNRGISRILESACKSGLISNSSL